MHDDDDQKTRTDTPTDQAGERHHSGEDAGTEADCRDANDSGEPREFPFRAGEGIRLDVRGEYVVTGFRDDDGNQPTDTAEGELRANLGPDWQAYSVPKRGDYGFANLAATINGSE